MFVPYDNYIDLDSELWADVKDANDAMMWNGGHYMAIVEVTGDNCAIIYNRKTMDETVWMTRQSCSKGQMGLGRFRGYAV